MAMGETDWLLGGGINSAYTIGGTYPGIIDLDADGDGVIDSHWTVYNDPRYDYIYCSGTRGAIASVSRICRST